MITVTPFALALDVDQRNTKARLPSTGQALTWLVENAQKAAAPQFVSLLPER
jgi:hypothetical protein